MLCTDLLINHDAGYSSKTAWLECEQCHKKTPKATVLPQDPNDQWLRLEIKAKNWTRRLVGSLLSDLCPKCSR